MNANFDPWKGLRPHRPPFALREHVLAAAREAAAQTPPSLFRALYHDRLLRFCAAGLTGLLVLHAIVTADVASRIAVLAPTDTVEGVVVPAEYGTCAAEQRDALAPDLGGVSAARRKG